VLKRVVVTILTTTLLVACGGSSSNAPTSNGSATADELIVQAANYDLVSGESSRFIAGVLTQDQLFVSYGTVAMKFSYLGTKQDATEGEPGPTTDAHFVAIEGNADQPGPIAAPASSGRGVYETNVTFDKPGYWSVELTADLNSGTATGTAAFQVNDKALFPAVGDKAPSTENLTVDSKAPAAAIDSRAGQGKIPDPELHQRTIAESIADHKPALVVFSTPVYCISRFCGPVTDMVQSLAHKYSNCANFIHVEIWWNFQKSVVNRAAAQWLLVKGNVTEPWVFLIGADGKIAARWDNVVVADEVEPYLKKLPCKG
jgi:hypothetical protein